MMVFFIGELGRGIVSEHIHRGVAWEVGQRRGRGPRTAQWCAAEVPTAARDILGEDE